MKILSKKQWENINQTVVDLQLELSTLKCENDTYFEQVSYLQNEITKLKKQKEKKEKVKDDGKEKKQSRTATRKTTK